MLTSSRPVKMIALASACAVHGAILWSYFGTLEIEMEGAAGSVEASLGNSFADMAQGSIAAEEVEEVTEAVTPEELAEVNPPDPAEVVTPEAAVTPEPQTVTPETQAMEVPETPLPQVAPVPAEVPQVTVAETPPEPTPDAPQPEVTEVIEAEDERMVTTSLRPKPRSKEFEKRVTPKKKVAKAEPKKAAQPRGNAQQNATTGSNSASSTQKQQVASVGSSRKQEAGNAAASNYPGKVMKKISRVPKPRVGSKGTSVVAFTIAPGGALSAISLARSSGSPKLDQAALRVVRKAAPFPPPPAGARRSFSINIKGR